MTVGAEYRCVPSLRPPDASNEGSLISTTGAKRFLRSLLPGGQGGGPVTGVKQRPPLVPRPLPGPVADPPREAPRVERQGRTAGRRRRLPLRQHEGEGL